jgi:hypothetical protein
MSANHPLSTPEAIKVLNGLIGSKLVSCGAPRLLSGTRTAIGRAFIETDNAGVVCVASELQSYDINGIREDFAVVSVSAGEISDVSTAYSQGTTFFDFANSIITDVGIIRTEFTRELAGEPIRVSECDLGVMVTTEKGQMALFNASIWVNEIDFVATTSDSSVGDSEGFVSELGDVWTSTISVVSVND